MKRILLFLLSIALLFSITACGSEEEPQTSATQTQEPEPSVTVEAGSPTTGLPGNTEYKPVAVMIENSSAARPQTGIQAADIVYEAPVESSITRFMCIFNDNYPEVVGPVRSARIYYVKWQQEWDAAFVHYGGPQDEGRESYIYGDNAASVKVRINGVWGRDSKFFWRSSARSAPHNAYTNVAVDVGQIDYTQVALNTLLFSSTKDYGTSTATRIGIPFSSSNKYFVEYNYDSGKDVYVRSMSGKKFTDAATGNAVEVTNVIVQYANVYVIKNDSGGRKNIDLVGEGKAEFFIGGKHITGTWKKTSYDSGTVFYDDNGKQIELHPGNTWIHIQPDTNTIVFS